MYKQYVHQQHHPCEYHKLFMSSPDGSVGGGLDWVTSDGKVRERNRDETGQHRARDTAKTRVSIPQTNIYRFMWLLERDDLTKPCFIQIQSPIHVVKLLNMLGFGRKFLFFPPFVPFLTTFNQKKSVFG